MPIDETIVQFLIDVRNSSVIEDSGQDMSEQLHRSKMTQNGHHAATDAQVSMKQIKVFHFDSLLQFRQRQNTNLERAKNVGA